MVRVEELPRQCVTDGVYWVPTSLTCFNSLQSQTPSRPSAFAHGQIHLFCTLLTPSVSMALLQVELYPSKRYVEVLTPGACDCVIWKQGMCRCNQIKMRSYGIRVGPKPNKWFLYKETETWRHTQGRNLCDNKGYVTMDAGVQLAIYPAIHKGLSVVSTCEMTQRRIPFQRLQ